ncbi:MAG: hypothetical protein JXA33_11350 [Anaerolineae bacterium]|nr:hypothetical protein [Anaerolineae bacterium]
MTCAWKSNWETTKQHFLDWWHHEGLVFCIGGTFDALLPHETVVHPGNAPDIEYAYTQPEWRARWNHYQLSKQQYPADVLPVANTDIGPGSLALFMGGDAKLAEDTVWFTPCIATGDPERHPPLRFDPGNSWWLITEATLRACAELGRGKYLVGCPDLIEDLDIVAALRDPQLLLMDMIERPDWVLEKVDEVNQAFFEAYQRIYDIIKLEDGSSCFGAFRLWGPGKVYKVQCDTSAMFSSRMFTKFVVPALTAQCEWLDYSMYHLDGHQCISHLDLLLDIEPLDAIEWTPDPQVPSGGDPAWYAMYRKILNAGKSVQAVGVKPEEVEPLLDAVGGKGMYIMTTGMDMAQMERVLKVVEGYP